MNGHANVVPLLPAGSAGANPLATSPNGVTPLMMAAPGRQDEVLKVLLEYGADDSAQKNDKGETAYDWAVREEQIAIEMLKKLRQWRAGSMRPLAVKNR